MSEVASSSKTTAKRPRARRAPRPDPAARRVLLTGATGFVGRNVLRELLAKGFEIVAVARSRAEIPTPPGVIRVAADLNGEGWQRWSEGCSAAIHLVGVIREVPAKGVTFDGAHRIATEKVVQACRQFGIPRLVHMSALGARPQAATAYHRTKAAAEEVVRGSGLVWTIFRPSMIFGVGDGFTTALVRALRRAPVFPVFGDGSYRLQPIAVEEVARAMVASLDEPRSEAQVIELGGPEVLTYNDVLRRIGASLGRRPMMLHLPLGLSRLLVSLAEKLPSSPITLDQLTMLLEGSTCDTRTSNDLFGIPRARFQGVAGAAAQP